VPLSHLLKEGNNVADIDNYRNNHPELVVRDLREYVDPQLVRQVLKFRGVNKWLRVRRLLINLKHRWLAEIHELETERREAKAAGDYKRATKISARIETLADCRQQVRSLCHSPRDIDFPHHPKKWPESCQFPDTFPKRPHKRWFWRNE
jgi:hypothetical protein